MDEQEDISLDVEAESSAFAPIINFTKSSDTDSFVSPADSPLPDRESVSNLDNYSLPETEIIKSNDQEELPERLNVEIFENAKLPESTLNSENLESAQLPENSVTGEIDQTKIVLPESDLIQNTEVESIKSGTKPEYSEIISNFSIKVDAEAAYEKAKDLEGKVNSLDKNMNDLRYPKGNWINNSEKDKYEERPTVEATNLVFDARLKRFASRPIWV
jgi:hypothetical protein